MLTGAQAKLLRMRAGLSQSALAKILDVDVMTVSNRERDLHPISRETELAMRYVVSLPTAKARPIASPPAKAKKRATRRA